MTEQCIYTHKYCCGYTIEQNSSFLHDKLLPIICGPGPAIFHHLSAQSTQLYVGFLFLSVYLVYAFNTNNNTCWLQIPCWHRVNL